MYPVDSLVVTNGYTGNWVWDLWDPFVLSQQLFCSTHTLDIALFSFYLVLVLGLAFYIFTVCLGSMNIITLVAILTVIKSAAFSLLVIIIDIYLLLQNQNILSSIELFLCYRSNCSGICWMLQAIIDQQPKSIFFKKKVRAFQLTI